MANMARAAQEQRMAKANTAWLPKLVSSATMSGGEAAETRFSGKAMPDAARA